MYMCVQVSILLNRYYLKHWEWMKSLSEIVDGEENMTEDKILEFLEHAEI